MYTKLRTNHCAELKYYKKKLNDEEDEKCRLCGEYEEKSEHLVCECPGLDIMRRELFLDNNVTEEVLVQKPEEGRKMLSKVFKKLMWKGEETPETPNIPT